MRASHTIPPIWPEQIAPSRYASSVRTDAPGGCAIALVGLPDDLGVRMNNGRPGARGGPSAFRAALARYGAGELPAPGLPSTFDAGDVTPDASDLDETHRRVSACVGELLDAGLFPVGIGGGHDLTYPFVRAVSQHAREPLVGVYFDAHLDVRDEQGSGMPFRRLLEGGHASALHVHGLDHFANTSEHVNWFRANNGHIDDDDPALTPPDDLWPEGSLFVSLDLDVIDQAHAPGVSATNPAGWSSVLAARWCRAAGRCERVRCFDIMELNPEHDEHQRTARLAARLYLEFLAGFAERPR